MRRISRAIAAWSRTTPNDGAVRCKGGLWSVGSHPLLESIQDRLLPKLAVDNTTTASTANDRCASATFCEHVLHVHV